jgi:ABC-2 type transport system permease protein
MIFSIARHELQRLYTSPFAWGLMALIQFLLAVFFFIILNQYLQLENPGNTLGISNTVVAGTIQTAGFIMILLLPFLSMRFFSEEQRSKTLTLLFSSPVSITELVLGKYLSILFYLYSLLLVISLMPLSLSFGTSLDLGLLASGVLALILLVTLVSSIGVFVSTLTSQSMIAASGTFAICFFLWIVHMAGDSANSTVNTILAYLSMFNHYNNLVAGIVSATDIIYFLLLSAAFISLSIWRLDAMRSTQ